eukprot:CAMPEP_0174372254 /NCGR_PEP_ID=MMETSP0811_2-20130205/102913_1 /TAXON_ID=73025 ORGANISM="Eutreptiella gymnastica-like, Strain CCMP1594" /NCGR_SAMPLE_ID=MMETSP0811_2 /ASSEMBLY_ACC=CAM_ASM_000667 /LENGTH=60 /DNA_ID=CAMNT_0015519477 /DNA_START=141 /DNA_END=323 /DNA_ORIENTATION=-
MTAGMSIGVKPPLSSFGWFEGHGRRSNDCTRGDPFQPADADCEAGGDPAHGRGVSKENDG